MCCPQLCTWGAQKDIVCVIKAFFLLSVISLVSVGKTEEVKDDTESKADGGEDRDESSKVNKKFS